MALVNFHSFVLLNDFEVRMFHDSDFKESVPMDIRDFQIHSRYRSISENVNILSTHFSSYTVNTCILRTCAIIFFSLWSSNFSAMNAIMLGLNHSVY